MSISFKIDTLITSLPQPQTHQDAVRKALVGVHQIVLHSQGKTEHYSIQIDDAILIGEGEGAAAWCSKNGIFPADPYHTGIIDCGRGTAIVMLVSNEDHEIIPASRKVFDGFGVEQLAQMIASDPDMQKRVASADPSTEIILSAILEGRRKEFEEGVQDAPFIYGTNGFNFRDIYEHCVNVWLKNIRGAAMTHWRSLGLHELVSRIVFSGGGGNNATVWADSPQNSDGFIVVPRSPDHSNLPQMINALGMLTFVDGVSLAIDIGNGNIKIASTSGTQISLPSYHAFCRVAPDARHIKGDTFYSEYVSGNVSSKFGCLVGSGAKRYPGGVSTVNTDKHQLLTRLVAACIPQAMSTQGKVRSLRRGVA